MTPKAPLSLSYYNTENSITILFASQKNISFRFLVMLLHQSVFPLDSDHRVADSMVFFPSTVTASLEGVNSQCRS